MKLHTLSRDALSPRSCHQRGHSVGPELGLCRLRGRAAALSSWFVTQDAPLPAALVRRAGRGPHVANYSRQITDHDSPIAMHSSRRF
jgi:hypothetical protein